MRIHSFADRCLTVFMLTGNEREIFSGEVRTIALYERVSEWYTTVNLVRCFFLLSFILFLMSPPVFFFTPFLFSLPSSTRRDGVSMQDARMLDRTISCPFLVVRRDANLARCGLMLIECVVCRSDMIHLGVFRCSSQGGYVRTTLIDYIVFWGFWGFLIVAGRHPGFELGRTMNMRRPKPWKLEKKVKAWFFHFQPGFYNGGGKNGPHPLHLYFFHLQVGVWWFS